MASPYRTEDLLLPRKKPAARPPLYESRHIAVADSGQKNGGQKNTEQKNGNLISGFSVHLTWITTWATQCTVELGDGQKIVESLMTQNHHRTAHRRTGADFHRSILSPSQAH